MGRAVAFVTGASRGIGRGIALQLAAHGFDIVAAATKAVPTDVRSGVYEVKARVEQLGQRCLPVAGDISDLDSHHDMIHRALDQFGAIDLLVNNAGVAPLHRLDILETTVDSYDRLNAINARGPFFLTQAVARVMIEQVRAGRAQPPQIVFITSISANTASPNRAEYCVSKAALSMTAQNYAVRLAQYGINVYEIRPGIIATDMTEAVKQKYDDLIAKGLLLQGRWGTPDDIGKAVVGLAQGWFSYATGAVIEVGGGFGVNRL